MFTYWQWDAKNTFQWNFIWNSEVFIKENAFQNAVCQMAAILSLPQCISTCHAVTLMVCELSFSVTQILYNVKDIWVWLICKLEQLERLRSEDNPPPPHDYPYYWPVHFESQVHTIDQFISDPKSKQDESRKILWFCYKLNTRHTL